MDLALLRDKSYMTELAILFALHREPDVRLSHVADRLGVTPQAVSNYAKRMVEDGLLDEEHRPTPEGIQTLHERIREVKGAVDGAYQRLSVVTETVAVAGEAIDDGQPVGLVLEDGLLTAYPDRDASSRGTADGDAEPGETVTIRDLEGIVDIRPGTVRLLRWTAADRETVERTARGLAFDRVGGLGTGAKLVARRLDAPMLEFAPAEAAFEAAQLGLDVLLLAEADRVRDAVDVLEERNADALIPVRYELEEV